MYKSEEERQSKLAYYRSEYARRRASWFKGKSCVGINNVGNICGATGNLEVDHVDPSQKSFTIRWCMSWKKLLPELAKCQPLCVSCHKKKTSIDKKTKVHGITMYATHKCRCDICRAANAASGRRTKARKKERELK